MSIKKLFSQHRTDSRDYSDYADDKTTFDSVESSRNASEISIEKNTFVPQVDYSQPHKFAKFGSAELYYSGAMTHIIDYYPYDGSDAEKNKFYNGLMPVERYIFDKKYPRFNGYGILSAAESDYVDGGRDGGGGLRSHSSRGFGALQQSR